MSLLSPPPSLNRLKPLACSILLALATLSTQAQEALESPAPQAPLKMGAAEIELPAGVEEEKHQGTSQKGLEVLQAIEVKGEWETKDEIGQNNVFAKDVSNVYAGKDDLERYKGASVSDLFKGLNGVYSGDARNSGSLDPNIRGIQGEGRIPVTVDGTEQATSVWMGSAGVANRNYVDPNMIGSIAVEKGPSMSSGIKSGIGGSVEIKTLDVDDIVRPGESFGLEIKTETATNSIKPNESGMKSFGRDYRDIDGAYAGYDGNLTFSKGGGTEFSPRGGSHSGNFDFNDNAFRIATATRQDNFDLFAAYSYRNKGNYFSGKGGSQRYQTSDWLADAKADAGAKDAPGDANVQSYVANLFLPGHEVANTSSEMRTTLLKGILYLPDEQSLKLSYMHNELEYGESSPYLVSYYVGLDKAGGNNIGLQFPYSQVKQDTYNLNYSWNPDNPLIDLKTGLWMTRSDSERHQNGDDVYGITAADVRGQDVAWDNYVRCQAGANPSSCGTAPEKLPNINDRYTIYAKALQLSKHDRWGVNVSNKLQLTDDLAVTLASDFSHEKLEQKDASEDRAATTATWGNRHMGPRSGNRQQYNFSFTGDWSPTSWLVLSAGARYSDYNSFDEGLKRHRENQDANWQVNAPTDRKGFEYRRVMSDAENQQFVDAVNEEFVNGNLTAEDLPFVLDKDKVNGVRYTTESVDIPFNGFTLDRSQNPFLNGGINLQETVNNPQGVSGDYARYLVNRSYTGVAKSGAEPTDKWALPKKRKDSAWAPMAGATVFLTEHARVYLRYTEFVRFPSIYEDTQAASGFGGTGVSNNAMRPEHSYNWEVGYAHDLRSYFEEWRHADFKINYYNNTIRDYVDRDYNFNIVQYDKKVYSGIELQTRFDTGKYFTNFSASYRLQQKLCDKDYAATLDPYYNNAISTCVTAGFPTTFARSSLQPDYSLNLDSGLRLFNESLELGGRMIYHSSAVNKDEEDWIRNGVMYVDGFNRPLNWHPIWVFDTYASYHVNKNVDVDFGINNLTNRYYLDPLARVMMPAPGRTLKLGLTARF